MGNHNRLEGRELQRGRGRETEGGSACGAPAAATGRRQDPPAASPAAGRVPHPSDNRCPWLCCVRRRCCRSRSASLTAGCALRTRTWQAMWWAAGTGASALVAGRRGGRGAACAGPPCERSDSGSGNGAAVRPAEPRHFSGAGQARVAAPRAPPVCARAANPTLSCYRCSLPPLRRRAVKLDGTQPLPGTAEYNNFSGEPEVVLWQGGTDAWQNDRGGGWQPEADCRVLKGAEAGCSWRGAHAMLSSTAVVTLAAASLTPPAPAVHPRCRYRRPRLALRRQRRRRGQQWHGHHRRKLAGTQEGGGGGGGLCAARRCAATPAGQAAASRRFGKRRAAASAVQHAVPHLLTPPPPLPPP